MATTALISILCADRIGLVAAIAGRLFDLGGNLADTTFAVLGGGAEFTAVCEFPEGVTPETIEAELRGLPELKDADVTVSSFDLAPVHGPSGHVTHRITVSGGDRPGLIARLCEVFVQFEANVVRLNAERIPRPHNDEYVVNVAVWIPDASARSCLATVTNTAGELGLSCQWEEA
jgi:glycine cleavage system transcriptional repressor